MKPLFCFIDDSAFELDVFQKNIAASDPGLKFILGSTYPQVKAMIGDDYPVLFILDLYGRDPDLPRGAIPPQDKLAAEIAAFPSLDEIYRGLADYPGDQVNEYLKRMFHLTDSWRQLFARIFRATGQNINYGLSNYRAAVRDFPAASAAAYTRKSIIADAEEALAAGLEGLNLKPDAGTDEAIHQITREKAPGLIQGWSRLVTRKYSIFLRRQTLALCREGLDNDRPRLLEPDNLSPEARNLLGPNSIKALRAMADWREYSSIEFDI